MEAHEFIEGHDQVVARFGRWPSFHDGEVHRLVFDRTRRSAAGAFVPTIELFVRGWIMTHDDTGTGFRLEADSVVHFVFADVFAVELEGFNHQNVLSALNLAFVAASGEAGTTALHVELEHCYEFSCRFSTRKARVAAVVPYGQAPC